MEKTFTKNKIDKYIKDLKIFKEKHGHTKVPVTDRLGSWLRRQRFEYNKSPDVYIERKNEIKKELDKIDSHLLEKNNRNLSWQNYFNKLISFKKKYGHTNVFFGNPQYKDLYKWCERQRRNNKLFTSGKNHWTEARKVEFRNRRTRMIEAVDFNFNLNASMPGESKDLKEEIIRLIDQYHKKHPKEDIIASYNEHLEKENEKQMILKDQKESYLRAGNSHLAIEDYEEYLEEQNDKEWVQADSVFRGELYDNQG